MADTIVRTFSLLTETDQKLEELTKITFRRNKGDVIDFAVSRLYDELVKTGVQPVEEAHD